MATARGARRFAGRGRSRARTADGVLAGLAGAAVVDLAGRVGARVTGAPRPPTISVQLVAASLRGSNSCDDGAAHHRLRRTITTRLRLETPTGPDANRIDRVGTAADYLWGAGWGAVRVVLEGRSGMISAALSHFLALAATHHVLLAVTGVGAPLWARHDPPDDNPYTAPGPRSETNAAIVQLAQILVYVATTNTAYWVLRRR